MSAAGLGALTAAIPCLIFCFMAVHKQHRLKEQLSVYEEQIQMQQTVEIYCLKTKKQAGECIQKSDVVKRSICIDKNQTVNQLSLEEIAGKRCKVHLSKGTILQKDQLYEGKEITKDMRYHTLTFVELPQDLQQGDLIDIRIFFPNGEDYVVAGKKAVRSMAEDEQEQPVSFSVLVTEEELLRLAGAYVDLKQFADTRVYAIKYAGEFQEEAQVNYPVNKAVFELMQWDPNIVESLLTESSQARRQTLEEHLSTWESTQMQDGTMADIEQEELLELFE